MEQKTASACKLTWKERMAALGSGLLIVGSFIEPDTVTSSIRAGATYGSQLFWYVIFSATAVIMVQGVSVRLSIITREGLAENLKNDFADHPLFRNLLCGLVALAIAIGGFAYIGKDLTGTALGISALTDISTKIIAPVWGLYILLILNFAGDAVKYLEKLLGICVIIMAVILVIAMVTVRPNLRAMFAGCVPSIPEDSGLMTCLSLIGTTVVPYDMFLHAASAKRTWYSAEELPLCNFGITFPMVVSGIVTGSTVVTSVAVIHDMTVNNAMDMAIQLEPALGALARPFMAIDLVAVGISSAVCTLMRVSYVLAGLSGWKTDSSDKHYMFTNVAILITSIVITTLDTNPLGLAVMVQAVNGIVLSVAVGVTVYLICREKIMGQYKNNMPQTVLDTAIFTVSLILGVSNFLGVFF